MKITISIFDILGAYCGMHYYDMAFADVLRKRRHELYIYSNFKERESDKVFFPDFFSCKKLVGIIRFLTAYMRFLKFVLFSSSDRIVYLTYGEFYELPFLFIACFSRRVYVDVHEIHALKYDDASWVSRIFERLYRNGIRHVIYHSERTRGILNGNDLDMLYVPHFKYVFQKEYRDMKLADEVKTCFQTDYRKFLFFGNLSTVKGIDTVMDVFKKLKSDNRCWELVVAGKNVDNIDFSDFQDERIKVIDRHINDDELVYLYVHTDFILLPYKKSSQSGIFAMAAYFHKPMILSEIPYFKKMIEEYPSFGVVAGLSDFQPIIQKMIDGHDGIFYTQEDCNRFEMKNEIDKFVNSLCNK